ncbi:MAG: YafY family transcriptional regulator [Mucilaginibacter polytrichastri]|nr:YafY family transcriptional regulator [Mucilaginibacter polytrichastri]
MQDKDTKRLTRMTTILLQLQTRRLTTARSLAERFDVSLRTIYRDIRALEQAGVPVLTEEGKGYMLMEGYRIPPVSFTEEEAHALITAQKIIAGNSDTSLVAGYMKAVEKVRAVLRQPEKDSTELLLNRIAVAGAGATGSGSRHLSELQRALTRNLLTGIVYQKEGGEKGTHRMIEPFALLSTQGNWLLVAWCRLRVAFRMFRLDRMQSVQVLDEHFDAHQLTLEEYFAQTKEY